MIHTAGGKPLRQTRHQCKHCNKWFKPAVNFRQHNSSHTDDKTFMCPQCGQCLHQAGYAKKHKRHEAEVSCNASIHGNVTTPASSLEHKPDQDEVLTCWICQMVCDSEPLLLKHYDDHMMRVIFTK